MTTIAETRRGSVLRKEQDTGELQKIIDKIAPKASPESRLEAFQQLQTAIDAFRMAYPHVVGDYRVRGSISEQREALARLSKSVNESIVALRALPLQAHAALSRQLGPRGKLISELETLAGAASAEYRKALKLKDHPDDHESTYLAFAVARVLRDTLSGRIALSSDHNTPHAPRNGAAYARLFRATLMAAGANAPDDLHPLLKAGKELLTEVSD
jgi:hypothetical protein